MVARSLIFYLVIEQNLEIIMAKLVPSRACLDKHPKFYLNGEALHITFKWCWGIKVIFVVRTQYIFHHSNLCVQTSSCGFLWGGPGELDSATDINY